MGAGESASDEFLFPLVGGSFDPVSDALDARGRRDRHYRRRPLHGVRPHPIALGEITGTPTPLLVDPTGRTIGLQGTAVTVSAAAQIFDGFGRLYEDRRGGDKHQDAVNAGETLGTVFLSAQAE